MVGWVGGAGGGLARADGGICVRGRVRAVFRRLQLQGDRLRAGRGTWQLGQPLNTTEASRPFVASE